MILNWGRYDLMFLNFTNHSFILYMNRFSVVWYLSSLSTCTHFNLFESSIVRQHFAYFKTNRNSCWHFGLFNHIWNFFWSELLSIKLDKKAYVFTILYNFWYHKELPHHLKQICYRGSWLLENHFFKVK